MDSQTTEQPLTASSLTSAPGFTLTSPHELATVYVIGVCGILGNGLVLVVLLKETYRKKLKNLLIIHQSFVDFIISIILIMTFTSTSFQKTYETIGSFWCVLIDSEFLLYILAAVSTVNLVALTLERYSMVVFPVIHRNYVNKCSIYITIGATWVIGVVGSIILYNESRVVNGVCTLIPKGASMIKIALTMFLGFWAPITIFLVVYPHMLCILRKRSRVNPAKTADAIRPKNKVQSNLITVLASVTLAFVACWGPTQIYYVMTAVDFSQWNVMLRRYLSFLGFANCSINPILYAFNYHDFKKGVRVLFRMKKPDTVSTVNTSNET